MKKVYILIIFAALSLTSFSQIIVNTNQKIFSKTQTTVITQDTTDYLIMVPHGRLFSMKVTCEVDYGQKAGFMIAKKNKVRNTDHKKRVFNSEADIINFFSDNGWEYMEYNSYAYIFRKKS